MNCRKHSQGFTLIELMIVVAIVGIITAVAVFSYSSSIEKARRSCATGALLDIAALQERNFFQNNQYSTDLSALYGATSCPDGYYDLSVAYTASGTACATEKNCFTITATAVGAQLNDEFCQTLTLTHTGLKGATGASGDTTSTCW